MEIKMNKFLKIVWSINGILILVLALFVGAILIEEATRNFSNRYSPPRVIVGKDLEKAKEKGLVLQGLDYNEPKSIRGTDGYLLPVRIKTYEKPKTEAEITEEVFYLKSSIKMDHYQNTVNVVFMDKDFKTTQVLLNKKGFIKSFSYPTSSSDFYDDTRPDTIQQHITYLIGFEDTNKDGVLDSKDKTDLYISGLKGENLVRVTTEVDVLDHSFINTNQILIRYINRDETRREHKREYFAKYYIKENKLEELTSLHTALDELEKFLVK